MKETDGCRDTVPGQPLLHCEQMFAGGKNLWYDIKKNAVCEGGFRMKKAGLLGGMSWESTVIY